MHLPEERQPLLTQAISGFNMLQINIGEPRGPMGGTKAESAAGKRGRPIEPAPGNAFEGTLEFELPFPGSCRLFVTLTTTSSLPPNIPSDRNAPPPCTTT